jgi:hypothetical protein
MSAERCCFIDGCRNPATLVIESYPDDVTLCDEHASLHGDIQPWERIVKSPARLAGSEAP